MYDEDLKRKWDNAAVLAGAEERGEERGIEKGLVLGKAEEKLQIARNLKSMNLDVESISMATGLSQEEIEKL